MKRKFLIHRRLRTVLGIALILIILGTGNLLIGHNRSKTYKNLLQKIQSEHETSLLRDEVSGEPIIGSSKQEDDRYLIHRNRLQARLEFYRLVELGGKCFLALSGLCMLAYLVFSREPELTISNALDDTVLK